jgi:excisionase family DNA binding protein
MTSNPNEQLLTYKEAASYLRITERFLRKLALQGDIASVLIGTRRLFRAADLDAYIIKQRVEAK